MSKPQMTTRGQMTDEQHQECLRLFHGPNGGGFLDSRSAQKARWNYASLGRRFGIFRSHARMICLGMIRRSIYVTYGQMELMRDLYFGKQGQGYRLARSQAALGKAQRWTYRRLAEHFGVTESSIDACLNRGRYSPRRKLEAEQRRRATLSWELIDGEQIIARAEAEMMTQDWYKRALATAKTEGMIWRAHKGWGARCASVHGLKLPPSGASPALRRQAQPRC